MISFLLVTLLAAFATAHFASVQKNNRQSDFLNTLGQLRRQAESGVHLALHELNYRVGSSDGNIGTEGWSKTSGDCGRDGTPSTHDEGEGDGIPTPGEPGLVPAAIGETAEAMGLLVRTEDSSWTGVKRIVSTSFSRWSIATIEVYVKKGTTAIGGFGAVHIQPGGVLDLKGTSFLIDGHDTDPDGSAGPGPEAYGISNRTAGPPGSNEPSLRWQIPSRCEDQVVGLGPSPSVGESSPVDFDRIFNGFKAGRTRALSAGSHSNPTWGDHSSNRYEVTYCNGDLHLSGNGKGAGALIVEGALTLTGKLEFVGLIMVRGDARFRGSGSGTHIHGSLMVGETLTAIDPDPDLGMSGNAEIHYSTVGLARAAEILGGTYSVLYWNDIR